MVSVTIRRQREFWWPEMTGDETDKQVQYWKDTGMTISDAAAVMVASWWQSSGRTGHVLASFASGCEVSREDLLDDIDRSVDEHGKNGYVSELEALRAWLAVQP